MLFNEPRFFLFVFVAFCITWAIRSNEIRKAFLLISSYLFYGCWDWRFLGLIFFATGASYLASVRIDRPGASESSRKAWLIFGVSVGVGMLFVFKYFNFFTESGVAFFSALGIDVDAPTINLVLPVGISFFTFQTVSYVADVYAMKLRAREGLLDYSLYVAFFPQLVAGPIVRASDFLPQLRATPDFQAIRWKIAITLFFFGFFKKTVISDGVAPYVDYFFSDPSLFQASDAVLAVLLYSLQIYCDFSGYTDMAIAVAAFFGYQLCPNFAHPYLATNISIFWRRWHISLSTWLRDYLYIPLGGSRLGELRTAANLLTTMLLGGLWHGAAWTFVAWGAMHGVALVVHRAWARLMPGSPKTALSWRHFLGWALTMLWVAITWVFFRATDLGQVAEVFASIVNLSGSGPAVLPNILWVYLGIALATHLLTYLSPWVRLVDGCPAWIFSMLFAVCVSCCIAFIPNGSRPFIYFQF